MLCIQIATKIENKQSNEDEHDQFATPSNNTSDSNEETSYPSGKGKIIRRHKFYIHSAWLALQSSYFRSLFFAGTKESSSKEVHVQISTNEEQAHLMLVEAMYKIDTLDNAGVDELLEVLRLAHKYNVKFVFKKCKYCLQAAVDSLEICKKIIYFITIDNPIPDVDDLVGAVGSFLAKKFSPLDKTWKTTSFKDLCEPLLKYLLNSDELVTVSENTVFHALMYWIEERGVENVLESQEISSLFSVIRFELIPFDYLYNIVQHHPVAKTLMGFNEHYLRGITYHASSRTMKKRLACQPAKRRSETQPFVAFTWVLPANKLDSDTLGITDETLESEEFWYCGYKMQLVITEVRKLKETSNFMAKLSLEIRNLMQQSEVSIQWEPKSPYFKFTPSEITHSFDKKACLSSVRIHSGVIYKVSGKVTIFPRKEKTRSARRNHARTTQSSFTLGTASSTPSTAFDQVPVSNTQTSYTFPTASSTRSTGFGGVPVSTTQSGFQPGTASSTRSTGFGGVPVSTTQSGFQPGTASSTRSIGFGGVPVSTTQSGFQPGTASSTRSIGFGGVPVSTTQSGFQPGTASSTRSIGFNGVPVSTTQSGFQPGTASSTRSIGFNGVPVSTTQSGFQPGTASSTRSIGFGGVPVSTTQSGFQPGTASSTRSIGFNGVPVSTTQSGFQPGTASSTRSIGFGGVPVSTTQSGFHPGTVSSTRSTGFGGVPVSTTQSSMTLGATSGANKTSVTPSSFRQPPFSFTGSTNTVEARLTSEPDSSEPSYVHIDVIMKLK